MLVLVRIVHSSLSTRSVSLFWNQIMEVNMKANHRASVFSVLIFLLMLNTNVYAVEKCPSAAEIRAGQFNGWLLINKKFASVATPEQIETFSSIVTMSIAARWESAPYMDGMNAECWYWGTTSEVLDFSLAKYIKKPKHPDPNYWIDDEDECHVPQCPFE